MFGSLRKFDLRKCDIKEIQTDFCDAGSMTCIVMNVFQMDLFLNVFYVKENSAILMLHGQVVLTISYRVRKSG